jgi:hypothetical protein
MFSLQQNWRRRGWKRFLLEAVEEGVAQTMYTYIDKIKGEKKKKFRC